MKVKNPNINILIHVSVKIYMFILPQHDRITFDIQGTILYRSYFVRYLFKKSEY